MATTAPSSRSRHSSSAAALRVVPSCCGQRRDPRGRAGVQTTSLSAGSRARVTPEATICASQRIGAPARSASRAARDDAGGEAEVVDQVDLPAGVDHPDRDLGDVRRAARRGRPRRGWWRRSGGRSRRRRGRSCGSSEARPGDPVDEVPAADERYGVDVRAARGAAAAFAPRDVHAAGREAGPGRQTARRARRRGRRRGPWRNPDGRRRRSRPPAGPGSTTSPAAASSDGAHLRIGQDDRPPGRDDEARRPASARRRACAVVSSPSSGATTRATPPSSRATGPGTAARTGAGMRGLRQGGLAATGSEQGHLAAIPAPVIAKAPRM